MKPPNEEGVEPGSAHAEEKPIPEPNHTSANKSTASAIDTDDPLPGNEDPSVVRSPGWFKAMRGFPGLELVKANPLALSLAYVIAMRARWHTGFNHLALEPGEALLGDFKSYGMSAREYRTAKHQLARWHFATFKTTNKGTIARLTDTRLFSISDAADDKQDGNRPTGSRQADDRQATGSRQLTKNDKNGKNENKGEEDTPQGLANVPGPLLQKDLTRLKAELEDVKDSVTPDPLRKAYLMAEIRHYKAEQRRRGEQLSQPTKPSVDPKLHRKAIASDCHTIDQKLPPVTEPLSKLAEKAIEAGKSERMQGATAGLQHPRK